MTKNILNNKTLYKSNKDKFSDTVWYILITNAIFFIFYQGELFFEYFTLINILLIPFSLLDAKEVILRRSHIVIKYNFLPFLYFRYELNNIEYFYFGSNNTPSSFEIIKIYLTNGKKKSFYFTSGMDFQILIKNLRMLNKNVQVISDKWK
ncbi:hypothetical protein [Marivirga harenae]|uniref:hypothetical protein n=1 Tax=Marivirga harenae TaxID=2010992 RepID=UPI0026DEC1C1|nr:hypothetical protein [Marivirga harenae]WKV12678.1 hypothetical protein Q3Y49_02395 [Marivirga harenae]